MLLYFEGFDAHSNPLFTGLDVGSMNDAGHYWGGGTPTKYYYSDGYLSGRAQVPGANFLQFADGRFRGETATRLGFWSIASNASTVPFILAGIGRVLGTASIWLRVNADWSLSVVDDSFTVLANIGGVHWSNTEWRHYELYYTRGGQVEIRVDGVLVSSFQKAPVPPNEGLAPQLSHVSFANPSGQKYDHLYVTDGPPLDPNQDLYGVQVVAGVDRYTTNFGGMQGSLIIGGNRYLSKPVLPIISGAAPYAQGRNLCNILNFPFQKNPFTGEEWSKASFSQISQWGLCRYINPTFPQPGSEIRITVAHLATLERADKGPIVRVHQASGATSFDGEWRKTDPDRTFSAHVRQVPRPEIVPINDAPALYVKSGCLLFGLDTETDTPGPTPEPPMETIGITFAEEFREDYRDWARVDGTGTNFLSSFVSGYGVYGEGNRKFQSNYVTVNYENVPTGGAYIQGLWDYSIDPDTGRWSMKQNVYKDNDGHKHTMRRLKIRGHGKVLQLRVSSRDGRPFKINGWTILASSNTNV